VKQRKNCSSVQFFTGRLHMSSFSLGAVATIALHGSRRQCPLRKYDVISISQDGGRDRWILLPVSYLLISLSSEGKSLLANLISSNISIDGWDITTSVFEILTSAILEFYFRFRSRPVHRNMHVILHQATEFCPIRSTHCGNVYYPFLKMAAVTAKYYFRFRICWCHGL